jgi:hypothetical protein
MRSTGSRNSEFDPANAFNDFERDLTTDEVALIVDQVRRLAKSENKQIDWLEKDNLLIASARSGYANLRISEIPSLKLGELEFLTAKVCIACAELKTALEQQGVNVEGLGTMLKDPDIRKDPIDLIKVPTYLFAAEMAQNAKPLIDFYRKNKRIRPIAFHRIEPKPWWLLVAQIASVFRWKGLSCGVSHSPVPKGAHSNLQEPSPLVAVIAVIMRSLPIYLQQHMDSLNETGSWDALSKAVSRAKPEVAAQWWMRGQQSPYDLLVDGTN